jgi:hypothetical protein
MNSPLPQKTVQLARTIFERRTRRGSWAYIVWLLAYLPLMGFIASFNGRPYLMLLLIPLAVVLVQLAYPTLLGWAVLGIPTVFCTGVMFFFVVVTAPARAHQHELAALVGSSVSAGVYGLVCGALWFARPKLVDAVVAESGAAPNGGPATPRASSGVGTGPPSVS